MIQYNVYASLGELPIPANDDSHFSTMAGKPDEPPRIMVDLILDALRLAEPIPTGPPDANGRKPCGGELDRLIGQRIKDARTAKRKSRAWLAEQIGVSTMQLGASKDPVRNEAFQSYR